MPEFEITKRFGRKITKDYQSWEFMTEIKEKVEANSDKELAAASEKLFGRVKELTNQDIENNSETINPQG